MFKRRWRYIMYPSGYPEQKIEGPISTVHYHCMYCTVQYPWTRAAYSRIPVSLVFTLASDESSTDRGAVPSLSPPSITFFLFLTMLLLFH